MQYQDTYDELTILLNDSTNVTFTPEQKARALQKAWNDSWVVKTVWDNTTLWSTNTFSYPLPATLVTVKDVYTQQSVDVGADPIATDLWEIVDGNIKFRTATRRLFNPGSIVYLKGNYKLDWNSDTLDTTNLQEYVLASAGYNTIDMLKYMKLNLFLKNDTSVSELIATGQQFKQDRNELRAALQHEFQGA